MPRLHVTRSPRKRSPASLSLADLSLGIRQWVLAAEIAHQSPHTQKNRRRAADHLLWFLEWKGWEQCGEAELIEFFAYISTAHLQPGGRWQEAADPGRWGAGRTRPHQPVKPSTVAWYYTQLRGLMNFLVRREVLTESPLRRIDRPKVPDEQIQPFTPEQVLALLDATKGTLTGDRDHALLLFMLDTACRSSELRSLRVGDLDMRGRSCAVVGKGRKTRMLHFTAETEAALWPLVTGRGEDDALFANEFGERAGQGMTQEALAYVFRRLGKAAGLKGVRCSPHTMRHTAAISWLRNGGDALTLQRILGHQSLEITKRYVALAEADIAEAYRTASPVANLLRRRR